MTKQTDWNEIEFLIERLAYVCFLESEPEIFKNADLKIKDISKFKVKILVEDNWVLDRSQQNKERIQMNTVFTLYTSTNNQITFRYNHAIFMPAIVKKAVVPNGTWQFKEFEFNKPDFLTMIDAEYLLEEKLGVVNV